MITKIALPPVRVGAIQSVALRQPPNRDRSVLDGLTRTPSSPSLGSVTDAVERGDLPVACKLGPYDGRARLRRWQQLGDVASPRARRDGPRLEVRYEPGRGVRQELESLAAAESECCSFVAWTVSQDGGAPMLVVTADADNPDAVAPIAELFGAA